MNNYISTASLYSSTYLAHHGIKGQKWGVRRYQNEDGSFTNKGLKRYGLGDRAKRKDHVKALNRLDKDIARAKWRAKQYDHRAERYNSDYREAMDLAQATNNRKMFRQAKQLKKASGRAEIRADQYRSWQRESESLTSHLLDQSMAKNEKIGGSTTSRSVMSSGERLVSGILSGASLASGGARTHINYQELGTKYK